MAIALVTGQEANNSGASVSSLAVTLPSNPTPGNLVVVVLAAGDTRTVSTFRDGNANNYAATPNTPSTNANRARRVHIYYLPNVPANGDKVITATMSGTSNMQMFAAEFSGAETSSPLEIDAAHSGTATAGTVTDPGVSTSNSGDLIIGGISCLDTLTVNAPFTAISTSVGNSWAEYYVQPSAGAITVNFTQGNVRQWAAMIAAFKAATGGGGGGAPLFRAPDLTGLGSGGPFFKNPLAG